MWSQISFHSLISIHALREEGDLFCSLWRYSGQRFLSTPSARRATIGVVRCSPAYMISIHALREEGDAGGNAKHHAEGNFYPRPPRGGRQATEATEAKQ